MPATCSMRTRTHRQLAVRTHPFLAILKSITTPQHFLAVIYHSRTRPGRQTAAGWEISTTSSCSRLGRTRAICWPDTVDGAAEQHVCEHVRSMGKPVDPIAIG